MTYLRTVLFLFIFSFLMLQGQDSLAQANLDQENQEQVLADADSVYKTNDIAEALVLYEKALAIDSSYAACWKYSRTLVDAGNLILDDDDKKEEIYRGAVKYADKAISLNDTDAEGYFVMAMCNGKVALVVGGQEKVDLSKGVKENALKAIELNPKHDGALHILGRWHREMTNLSWFLRTAASILYGGLPESSNEEAVKYFLMAIDVKPTHINHHFELAKTFEEMGEDEKAIQEYKIVIELKPIVADDPQHQVEAKESLDDLL